MTLHPFEANSFAVARPKPEEAPVMKIAFWSWLLIDASNSNGMIRPMLRWYKANCHDSPTNGAWHLAKNRSEIGEEGYGCQEKQGCLSQVRVPLFVAI